MSRENPPGRLTGLVISPKSSEPAIPRLAEVRRLPTSGLEDTAVAQAAIRGEDWAIDEVFRRYHTLVRGMVARALGPSVDAGDLVQDSLMQVFTSLPGLRDPSSLRAYVIGITIRVVRSELRRRRVRRILMLAQDGTLPDVAVMGDDHSARQAVHRLYQLLAKLGSEGQLVFTLRYLQGLELHELADALDVSLATAKRKLQKVYARVVLAASKDPILRSYTNLLPAGSEHE